MSRIRKTSETRPLTGHVVNAYSESESNAYSCDYANKAFGGKILWTNSSPASSFASQNITLSSDDYDMFEIIYFLTNYTGYDNRISTGKLPYEQGKKALISTLDYDGNSGVVTYRRNITMTSKTQFSVSNCEKNWNIGSSTTNTYAIPLYIIGYKTNLFN